MRYVVFGRDDCPFCTKAENLLQEKEKEHKIVNFTESQQDILQKIKDSCNWKTVPMIFQVSKDTNIKFLGGYTELCSFLEEEN